MIRIREQQREAIRRAGAEAFKTRLVNFVQESYPDQAAALSNGGVSGVVDLAIDRAARYALRSEKDLRDYLALMFRHGRDFDSDPELPFADRILQCRMVYERQPSIDHLLGAEEGMPPGTERRGYSYRHNGKAQ